MKKIILFNLSILFTTSLLAQHDIPLPGLVVRQNSRVKTGQVEYLSKVSIQATQAAAPTMSDASGSFTLVFADKPAYNVTRIFAEKSGMEVVNKTDLERAAVIGRLEKLKIVMCPAGELMESQMQYYGIAQEAIISRFKKRIAALEAANTDLDKLIAEVNEEYNLQLKTKNEAIYALEKEWSEALASAQETAQKFADINLDDADSLYLQADAAFKKGDFARVLQLLQYDLLNKNLRNIRSNLSAADSLSAEGRARIARGQENLRQTIQNALFAARVAKSDGAWKRAEDYYDLAVKGDEGDDEVIFEVAVFMQAQNQFAKARAYYEKALTITNQPYEKAPILNNLGGVLQANKKMVEAKQAYEEAEQIYMKLAEQNPEVYLPYVAAILNNLGLLLYGNNEMVAAKESYGEALQIYRKLAEQNPEVYLSEVAGTLNNLGLYYKANQKMEETETAYNEALELYRQLAKKNPDRFLPFVANTLTNLGAYFLTNQKMLEAEESNNEALKICRELANKNPDAFLPSLASILNDIGIYYTSNQKIPESEAVYKESLKIRQQLANKNPDAFLVDVASTFVNLASLYYVEQRIQDAEYSYDEALKIYRKLADKNPDYYLPPLSIVLNNLGICYNISQKIKQAEAAYNESLKIVRKLTDISPDVFLPNLAMALNNLGIFFSDNQKVSEALTHYNESLKIYQQLAGKNRDAFLPFVANVLNNLGVSYKDIEDYDTALNFYDDSKSIYETAILNGKNIFINNWLNVLQGIIGVTELAKDRKDYKIIVKGTYLVAESCNNLKDLNETIYRLAAAGYNDLSYWALFTKDYVLSEKSAQSCLELDNNQEWVLANLGHSQLLRGQYKAGMTTYKKLKYKKDSNGRDYKTILLEDLQAFDSEGVSHPDVAKAKKAIGRW